MKQPPKTQVALLEANEILPDLVQLFNRMPPQEKKLPPRLTLSQTHLIDGNVKTTPQKTPRLSVL